MKFTYFAISATFIVCAAAAATTTTTAPVPSYTPTKAELCLQTCVGKLGVDFANCQAECLGNPHPSAEQVNQNTKCVAGCDQGDGSGAATAKYAKCVADCGTKYFMPSATAPATDKPTANPTGGSQPSGSASPSGTGSGSGSGSGSGNNSNTTTSPTSKPTNGSSASSVVVSISFAGTIAAIAALFSL